MLTIYEYQGITIQMRAKPTYQPIVDAKYLHDYQIKVIFKDHTSRVVDLERLFKSNEQPFKRFATLSQFRKFRVEHSSLAWGDNECDIDPCAIYAGRYDAVLEHA